MLSFFPVVILSRSYSSHWNTKDSTVFYAEKKVKRHNLLLWRNCCTIIFLSLIRILDTYHPFLQLVIIGWGFIGMIVEIFGFFNLFGDFFPLVIAFSRRLPIIGSALNLPGIKQVRRSFLNNISVTKI